VRLSAEQQVARLPPPTASPNRKKQVTFVAEPQGARRSGVGWTCTLRFGTDDDGNFRFGVGRGGRRQ
jgi:hypothetical protein